MINDNNCCAKCHKPLTRDEIAIYLRLVSRDAKEYLCIPCLAMYFKCSEESIQVRIERLKEMGCTLFSYN
jgi:biotin operon repressor